MKAGQEFTYEGSDGQRHYAKVVEVHADGTVTVSRGYYGTTRSDLRKWGLIRDYRTGKEITL